MRLDQRPLLIVRQHFELRLVVVLVWRHAIGRLLLFEEDVATLALALRLSVFVHAQRRLLAPIIIVVSLRRKVHFVHLLQVLHMVIKFVREGLTLEVETTAEGPIVERFTIRKIGKAIVVVRFRMLRLADLLVLLVVDTFVDEILRFIVELVRLAILLSHAHSCFVPHRPRLSSLPRTLLRALAQKLLHPFHVLVVSVPVHDLRGAGILLDEVVSEMDFHDAQFGALVLVLLILVALLILGLYLTALRYFRLQAGLAVLEPPRCQLLLDVDLVGVVCLVDFLLALCEGQRSITHLLVILLCITR